MGRPVTAMKKTGRVTGQFDRAAASYDLLVAANPGYHRHLRISAKRLRLPRRGAALRVVDLGCGTGASTAALARAYPESEIIAVDASAGMLDQARRKPWSARVHFVHARAERLTIADIGGPADAVFAAYLLRNCPDTDNALDTMRRVLAPGGKLVLHEYSVADSAWARGVWSLVCWSIIIPLGRAVTGRTDLYRYLWRSVLDFHGVGRLRERMRAAGLLNVRTAPLDGWQRGIVHTFLGRAPRVGSDR